MNPQSASAVRSRLSHPVIDVDMHVLEYGPVFLDYVRSVGGDQSVRQIQARHAYPPLTRQGREESGGWTPPWWVATTNTEDYAAAALPRLLAERMDEFGIDLAILYPTAGLSWMHVPGDAASRQVLCRAANRYMADLCRTSANRIVPVAMVPMSTPQEAITELNYVVGTLGFRAIAIQGFAQRSYPWIRSERAPGDGFACRPDVFGIGSDHDYDPFWQRCVELGVAPVGHAASQGFGFRRNALFMYNHTGNFAAAAEALCKALFFGGVTHRFPSLRVGFAEGGAAWACTLFAGLLARWQKRGGAAIHRLDPATMDREVLMQRIREYGNPQIQAKFMEIEAVLAQPAAAPEELDDFHACGIVTAEDLQQRFVPHFFFGCPADDPMIVWAFNRRVNPLQSRLNAMYGSASGRWEVPEMGRALTRVYAAVQQRILAETDFRDFAFANAVRLYGGMNPQFFRGTQVEAAAAQVLAQMPAPG